MKILCCSVATDGFLFPSIAVAEALRDLGHEVAFVTDISRGPLLEQAGFERIPRGAKDGPSFEIERWFYGLPIAMQVKHIEYALERFPADVLLGQPLAVGPYIVRDKTELPLAVLGLAPPLWPVDPAVANGPRNEVEERRLGRHSEMMTIYNEARKLFQLPELADDFLDSPLLGDLYMAQTVPELWQAEGSLAERIQPVGACSWEPGRQDPDLDQWLQAGDISKPLIYVQFGRSFERADPMNTLFASLADKPCRIAASVGRCDSGAGTIPEGCFVRDLVPQHRVLAYADLVIHGGNTTAMLGALTHGLPSLMLFGKGEQTDVAEVCSAAGAGIARPILDVTELEISCCVDRLLDQPSFRLEAQKLQRAFRRQGGARAAAEHVVALASASGRSLTAGSMIGSR